MGSESMAGCDVCGKARSPTHIHAAVRPLHCTPNPSLPPSFCLPRLLPLALFCVHRLVRSPNRLGHSDPYHHYLAHLLARSGPPPIDSLIHLRPRCSPHALQRHLHSACRQESLSSSASFGNNVQTNGERIISARGRRAAAQTSVDAAVNTCHVPGRAGGREEEGVCAGTGGNVLSAGVD